MFVFERILRNLSEGDGLRVSSGLYEEMIDKTDEWRNEKIVDTEYHEVTQTDIKYLFICMHNLEIEIVGVAVLEGVYK